MTHYAQFNAPDLAPVLACEATEQGWRGLTGDGELLNVSAKDKSIPSSLHITCDGESVGFRSVSEASSDGRIDRYLQHFDRATALARNNRSEAALIEIDAALNIAVTATARFNRGLILLQLGRWPEGFDEYQHCEYLSSFIRPGCRTAIERGLTRWRGEPIAGKRLLLIHDHGFGDSIQMLRYVKQLKAMGADVVVMVPQDLVRLAQQCAVTTTELIDTDYFCSLLGLLHVLRVLPAEIDTAPYLVAEKRKLPSTRRKRIGIAWSVGKIDKNDYPRSIPFALLVDRLSKDAELISVQKQGHIGSYSFTDFADCASLMLACDEIVSVDTAALHLAGAIGHPRITALLSYWHSWRWLSPLYRNVQFCVQKTPGDWNSALDARCCQ